MFSSRLSIGALVCLACLAGCGRSSLSKGELPQGEGGGDLDPHDAARPDPDAGDDPAHMDSGRPDKEPIPSSDAGFGNDDAGMGSDAAMDAGIIEDAGDGGDGDAGKDAEIIETDPLMCSALVDMPRTQLGTPWEPFEHALTDGALHGEVDWRGRGFIRITGVTPGQGYLVMLTGEQVELAVFADEDVFGAFDCMSGTPGGVSFPAVCLVTPTESTLDITVHALSGVQPFELEIIATNESEGTREMPLAIGLADLPRALVTEPGQPSYYEITGVTQGATYAVKGTPFSNTLRLGVFQTTFDTVADLERTPRGAIVQAIGTSLLVAVIGQASRESMTLDVTEVSYGSEGTREAPVVIAADELFYEGEIGWAHNNDAIAPGHAIAESFYAITGLAPGDYTVSVSSVPALQLSVYGDEPFTDEVPPQCMVTPSRATDIECGAHIDGSTLYLKVINHGGDGSPLTLDVAPSPYSTEGTEAAPLELTRADLPHAGEALGTAVSSYRISGLTPGKAYVVRVSEPSALGLDVRVLDETVHTLCEVGAAREQAAQCKVRPEGTSLIVRVAASFEADGRAPGGSFLLDLIEVDDRPTSSFDYPIPIECTEGVAMTTLSGSGSSFYRISDLEPGTSYVIEASSPNYFNLIVHGQLRGDQDLCNTYGDPVNDARCLVTPASSSVIVSVISEGFGDPIELVVRRPQSGSEGTATTPIAVALDQLPFTGQVATASPSYYAISGLTPGATYTMQVASAQEGVLIEPFGDLGMIRELGAFAIDPGGPGELQFTASTENLLLRITLLQPSDWITDVSIDLLPE